MPRGAYMKRVAMLPVPKDYLSLLEEEMVKLNKFAMVEITGHIMKTYFGDRVASISENHTDENLTKEEKGDVEDYREPFVPHLRPR